MWQYIVGIALGLVATFAIRPKTQDTPPPSLDDSQLPTAEEGRTIPVLFGCRDIRGANVVWYGDYKTTNIKVKGSKK